MNNSLKIACYTCITGNYDSLKPVFKSDNIDFICFTDNQNLNTFDQWQLRSIPLDLEYISNVKKQRIIKICPHRYLKEYDVSIWVDANLQIKDDLNKLLKTIDFTKSSLWTKKHPLRNCIVQESTACINLRKDSANALNHQVNLYLNDGYPKLNGMCETNVIIRKHNEFDCQIVCNFWATQLMKYSHRDQISFNYSCWKNRFNYMLFDKQIVDSTFRILQHNSLNKKYDYLVKPIEKNKFAFVIVNFNTTALTETCIKSIIKNVKSIKYDLIVFDNSDRIRFKTKIPNIKIIDNTKQFFLNFTSNIELYSKVESQNKYASFKHALTIQWLLDYLKYDNAILFDSDVILKKDIDFVDYENITIAGIQQYGQIDEKYNKIYTSKTRFLPYIQYFNLKMLRGNRYIRYFDCYRMHGGYDPYNSMIYDTGSSFTEDILNNNLKYKEINYHEYVNHLGAGSWKNVNAKKFINDNIKYF